MWKTQLSRKVYKSLDSLPQKVRETLAVLLRSIEQKGPVRGDWKNYGKLGADIHHCHLNRGRPTYVVCWRVDKAQKLVKVYYVGTHEKAPY